MRGYAELLRDDYAAALEDAIELRAALDRLVAAPSEETLAAARAAWLASRDTYGRTEIARFYEGPIDRVDPRTGEGGIELRINAWPVDESAIDAVRGRPDSGLIQDLETPLDDALLVERNQRDSDTAVLLGYHAIEFLLWGQDLDPAGPGARPASDFDPATPAGRRRGEYLRIVAERLVADLRAVGAEWSGAPGSYAAGFVEGEPSESLRKLLTGLEKMTGFEMALERLAVPLDSGDPEDEHSCFSDNTHADFRANLEGLERVWERTGLAAWAGAADPALRAAIDEALAGVGAGVRALPRPFDAMLAEPADGPGRARAERLVDALLRLADLWKLARLEAAPGASR